MTPQYGNVIGLTDTELLDFLERENAKARYTGRCLFRLSDDGRGWRLMETSRETAAPTVREAIAEAIRRKAALS